MLGVRLFDRTSRRVVLSQTAKLRRRAAGGADRARDTGARIQRIGDGGITGPAFFDHVRAVGRPVLN
jgi:DNA-binding transcriptional LysR family regulator